MKKGLYTSAYFIEKAVVVHGDKYKYDKTVYKLARIKVCITCPKHGDFYQTPNSHLNGNGCPSCGFEAVSKAQTDRIIVNCIVCGKEISKTRSWYDRSDRHLCSPYCRSIWAKESGIFRREHNPTWKGGIPTVSCSSCGKLLERDRDRIKRNKNFFCSKECRKKYLASIPEDKKIYPKRILVKCYTCGKEFLREKNQVNSSKLSFCGRECWAAWRRSGAWSKENSPTYKPEMPDEDRYWRTHIEPSLNTWIKNVKIKYNYTCQVCGGKQRWMIAHHLNSWNTFRELRVDVNNGICLCKKCHDSFHEIYKRGDNTQAQFDEFLENHKNECNL